MAQEQTYSQYDSFISDVNVRLRDIEDKQNLIKDRLLLIGENLLAEKQDTESEVSKIKIAIKFLENDLKNLKLGIDRILDFQENLAKRSEVETLKKQFKMFEPLQFARISDVEAMIEKALKSKKN